MPDKKEQADLLQRMGDHISNNKISISFSKGEKVAQYVRYNLIPHFYIRTTYYIPKQNVIDYLNSDHYKQYRLKLKNSI